MANKRETIFEEKKEEEEEEEEGEEELLHIPHSTAQDQHP